MLALALLLSGSVTRAFGSGLAAVNVAANPSILLADGRSTTSITATVTDLEGRPVADGTVVQFTTTSGTLSSQAATTQGSVARVVLTSSPLAGKAIVTASFISPTLGGANTSCIVEYTADSDLAYTDAQDQSWIRLSSHDYLAYSADSKILDAAAKKQGVRLAYRGLTIEADALQIDLDRNVVRARKAVLRRAHKQPLQVDVILYYLDAHQGTAFLTDAPGRHTVEEVNVDGAALTSTPFHHTGGTDSSDAYIFPDVSDSRVLVTASSASVRPQDQIQLQHATIYVDNKKIVSMPNHIMPLTTQEIFGQQVLGYGTDGVYLNIPYYASVAPGHTGAFYLRSNAAALQSGTYFSGRKGFALDYDNNYSHPGSDGDFKVVGLSAKDWGMRWTHSQKFGDNTRGYMYIDSPGHRSLFTSANMRHQIGNLFLNVAGTDSRALVSGPFTESRTFNASIETAQHVLFGTRAMGVNYSESISFITGTRNFRDILGNTLRDNYASSSLGLQLGTPVIALGTHTNITDSLTVEDTFDRKTHTSGLNLRGNLGLTTHVGKLSAINASYSYTHNPRYAYSAQPTNALPGFSSLFAPNRHDFTLGFLTGSADNRFSASINSTFGMPTKDRSINTELRYGLTPDVSLRIDHYYSTFAGFIYRDLDITLARRLGGRQVELSWSTLQHRIRFNFAPAQF